MQRIALLFASSALALASCHKAPNNTSTNVTQWGEVELSPDTPKHLKLAEGNECALTATMLADGNLQITIATEEDLEPGQTPPGMPPGRRVRTQVTETMAVPAGKEITVPVRQKLVRFTPQLRK